MSDKAKFSHYSLQDASSIADLLNALTEGLQRGKLELSDEAGELVLKPKGLIELSVEAADTGGSNTVTVQLRWSDAGRKLDRKALRIR